MVQDAAAGMPALQGHGNVLRLIPVKIHPDLLGQAEHVLRPLIDQDFQGAQIVFVPSGDKGVCDVQAVIVVGLVHHGGHPSLGEEAVAQRLFPLGQHQHPHVGGKVESRVQPGHAAARNQYVVFVLHVVISRPIQPP